MYLARREFGSIVRVYEVNDARPPHAWPYDYINKETGLVTSAGMSTGTVGGICATGNTRSEALTHLGLAEEAEIDGLCMFEEVER